VYLTDRIDNNKRERMAHMKCVCFLQNSEDSLGALEAELKEPRYGEYYLCQWVNAISFWHLCGPHSSSLLHLDFSNILTKTAIERLADADEYEAVREVQVEFFTCLWHARLRGFNLRCQEYFADYAPLLPSLFSLNYTPSASTPLYGSSPSTWDPKALDRHVQGLVAVMLSLKKKPVIRYEKMSSMARKLAVELQVRAFGFHIHASH
jgi:hypothetical protein